MTCNGDKLVSAINKNAAARATNSVKRISNTGINSKLATKPILSNIAKKFDSKSNFFTSAWRSFLVNNVNSTKAVMDVPIIALIVDTTDSNKNASMIIWVKGMNLRKEILKAHFQITEICLIRTILGIITITAVAAHTTTDEHPCVVIVIMTTNAGKKSASFSVSLVDLITSKLTRSST